VFRPRQSDPSKNFPNQQVHLSGGEILTNEGVVEQQPEHRARIPGRLQGDDDPLDPGDVSCRHEGDLATNCAVARAEPREEGRWARRKHGPPSGAKGGFTPPTLVGLELDELRAAFPRPDRPCALP
jgi:hypothetical protein